MKTTPNVKRIDIGTAKVFLAPGLVVTAMKTETSTRQPAESSLPFYHHANAERRAIQALPAVRWVKVAWLGSLLTYKGPFAPPVRAAAMDALRMIDDGSARGLVDALRRLADAAVTSTLKDLATDAAATVERAILDGAA